MTAFERLMGLILTAMSIEMLLAAYAPSSRLSNKDLP